MKCDWPCAKAAALTSDLHSFLHSAIDRHKVSCNIKHLQWVCVTLKIRFPQGSVGSSPTVATSVLRPSTRPLRGLLRMTNSEFVMVSRPRSLSKGPCRTTHRCALTLIAQRDGEVGGAPGALPGVPWGSARVFRLDADAPRDRYPGARGAQACLAFHPRDDPGRAGRHPRLPGARVYVPRAANTLSR